MNSVWRWIDPKIVRAIHDRQVAEHGGLKGVREPYSLLLHDPKTSQFTEIGTLPH